MSLAQHVSSFEGTDYEPDAASLHFGRRLSLTLSYDPLANLEPSPEGHLDGVGADKVSVIKRIFQVLSGVLICIFASGIVFGFAALKSVLVAEGIYHELCTEEELQAGDQLCYMQDQRLNLTFVIASITTNMGCLLVGSTLDRYGPRICGYISSLFLLVGSLCMAFAEPLPFDGYVAGSFFLALGGCFSFVPTFHLSNAFPKFQGLILALITGAFDASAAVFLVFRILYQSTNGRFGLRKFFLLYLIVPVLVFLSQLLYMPSRSYETRAELTVRLEKAEDPMQDLHDSDDDIDTQAEIIRVRSERTIQRKQSIQSIQDVLGTQKQRDKYERAQDERRVTSGVWGVLHGATALQQIRTPWFIFITIFTVLQMIRFNFFISTIWTQYEYLLDSASRATKLTEFFDVALPIGGVATVPFIGLLLDNTSTVTVLALIVLLSTVDGVLGAVPSGWAAYSKVCLFVIFRPLYYSAMSDYAAKVFGFATFGTVYGAIICISGLFTFTQSGFQALVHGVFQEDPGPVNLGLSAAGLIIGTVLVVYVDIQGRAVQRNILMSDDDERRSIMSAHRPSSRYGSIVGAAASATSPYNDDSIGRDSIRPSLHRHNLSTVRETMEELSPTEESP